MGTVDRDGLAFLAEKYRALIALRTRPGPEERSRLRSLAARWPGALRELDTRTDASLGEQLASIESALGGVTAVPDACAVQLAFHGWMRFALALRAAGARDLEAARAFAQRYAPSLPGDPPRAALDDDRLARLLRPASGRFSLAARALLGRPELDLDLVLFGASARERERR